MESKITKYDNAIVINFSGDIDLQSSPEARKVLLKYVSDKKTILVDLSKVEYIDSSGIASLVEALQTSRKEGSNLFLVEVSEAASRVLELARLDKVFKIFTTIEEALKASQ